MLEEEANKISQHYDREKKYTFSVYRLNRIFKQWGTDRKIVIKGAVIREREKECEKSVKNVYIYKRKVSWK